MASIRPSCAAARRWMWRTSSGRRSCRLRVRVGLMIVWIGGCGASAMDVFTKLFGDFLVFVYHCFDRMVIHGYLTALSRPELVVRFFRDISASLR